MMVIGLTGKACCGKNVVAEQFAGQGWEVVDVDKLGYPILQASARELERDFGPSVIAPDGTVDRKALGGIVFADPGKLKVLESITHPKMVSECRRIIQKRDCPVVVLNAALLSRMHLDEICDLVVFVKASYWVRYHRANVRDTMDLTRFRNRESAQKDITITNIRPDCEIVILDNNGSLESIHRQVLSLCAKISKAIQKDRKA